MFDAKPVDTPLANHFILSSISAQRFKKKLHRYQRNLMLVGCLIYAIVSIRLDLAHAINVLSKYMTNLDREHWRAIK